MNSYIYFFLRKNLRETTTRKQDYFEFVVHNIAFKIALYYSVIDNIISSGQIICVERMVWEDVEPPLSLWGSATTRIMSVKAASLSRWLQQLLRPRGCVGP
jgi:hypothetical protein